jgi:hypothetical protein
VDKPTEKPTRSTPAPADDRKARLAAALRDNLKRRKASASTQRPR